MAQFLSVDNWFNVDGISSTYWICFNTVNIHQSIPDAEIHQDFSIWVAHSAHFVYGYHSSETWDSTDCTVLLYSLVWLSILIIQIIKQINYFELTRSQLYEITYVGIVFESNVKLNTKLNFYFTKCSFGKTVNVNSKLIKYIF